MARSPSQTSPNRLTPLGLLLVPVVRFCLRRGIGLKEIVETLKQTLAKQAVQLLKDAKDDVSASRVAVITGLHRADVVRLTTEDRTTTPSTSVLAAVVGAWLHDRRYSARPGHPMPLSFEGTESEFSALARSVTKEISPYTILRELERADAVIYKGDRVVLKVREYVPKRDELRGWEIVSRDIDDLIRAAEGNITNDKAAPNLHLRTEFDNLSRFDIEQIKAWLVQEGAAFHERARNYLSTFDKDHTTKKGSGEYGARTSLGTFSLTEVQEEKVVARTRKRGRKKLVTGLTVFLCCYLNFLSGCGGGTTGTSGVTPRVLRGQAVITEGRPISDARMSAFSDDGNEVISSTSSEGSFEMKAFGSLFDFSLDSSNTILGFAQAAVLPAPSVLSSDVVVGPAGVAVSSGEVSLIPTPECLNSVKVDGLSVDIAPAALEFSECALELRTASQEVEDNAAIAELLPDCSTEVVTIFPTGARRLIPLSVTTKGCPSSRLAVGEGITASVFEIRVRPAEVR